MRGYDAWLTTDRWADQQEAAHEAYEEYVENHKGAVLPYQEWWDLVTEEAEDDRDCEEVNYDD